MNDQEIEEPIEAPARRGRPPKEKEAEPDATVLVKCVVQNEPWDSTRPLKYWADYELTPADAALLEGNKSVVILNPKKG